MRIAKMLRGRFWPLALGAVLVVALAAGCGQAAPPPSRMEVTHASYLDLSANIADLRTRVAQWQKGDEASLNIAKEKLERAQVVLDATGWPQELAPAVAKARAALAPMGRALETQDQAAAERVAKELGDASHDVTHAFYGDWLPALAGNHYDPLAAHVVYLDLSANVTDLQTRLVAWRGGDESSLNIAKEKTERAEALVTHLRSTGVMAKRLSALERGLLAMYLALEAQDKDAALQAIRPLATSARELAGDAYALLDLVAASDEPGNVQASYLDLTRNITALRAGVAAWQKGDAAGLAAAEEGLSRVRTVAAHAYWPGEMAGAVEMTRGAAESLATARAARNLAGAEAAAQEFGDASHDVTHAYYGDWLSASALQAAAGAASAGKTGQKASGGHGHEAASAGETEAAAAGTDWLVLGGFGAALALVIAVAAITKPRKPARHADRTLPQAGEA
ncbi:MAG: hypothetical protein ACYC4L_21415 [Chloroflexota bacterium]